MSLYAKLSEVPIEDGEKSSFFFYILNYARRHPDDNQTTDNQYLRGDIPHRIAQINQIHRRETVYYII